MLAAASVRPESLVGFLGWHGPGKGAALEPVLTAVSPAPNSRPYWVLANVLRGDLPSGAGV